MPNIASVLKDEIARVARKEMRAEIALLKKSSASHRADIAALKRRLLAAESVIKRLTKLGAAQVKSAPSGEPDNDRAHRFSAKGLASQRKRLGLSAADCGLLLGTSSQSVYNWETGAARPRAGHLAAIAALKTLGKKSAAAILESRRAPT